MTTLPIELPFELDLDPFPFYTSEIFPKNMYRHTQARERHSPIDMHTMGLISSLAPHFRHSKATQDLTLLPSKAVKTKHHDFHIEVDVGLFAPEEITVKIVKDHIVIEGNHEERKADDIGYVSRHFIRRYELPHGYNPDAIVSKLSSDGMLSVSLPKPTKVKERILAIQYEGAPKNKSIKEDNYKTDNEFEEDTTG